MSLEKARECRLLVHLFVCIQVLHLASHAFMCLAMMHAWHYRVVVVVVVIVNYCSSSSQVVVVVRFLFAFRLYIL